ncbi:Ser-Thr-rich glycosyl-phosphatidyl-inositol-anchored membrane family-domain-containing protein [Talaromyces proteolyticus]|uniref:Ser-Thr-rich glycosyl-phosphatidyl-inositol-anchored membrane family-domain-containing protein n=1 Tax=Talaromyces proteolyticus TaxID=1131652 RepID=A0AAD4KVM3_9EURO|nr:Ser-Thr-rich glycosyl-phosphatidyl-inositol-anchored membrane family-domain-containing protein [Talaromyces proteolyticus]KAH8700383.1 Ser-Thr-rich glycosyl-phosphatidyl-inositol-anchored membrane family-domain-containing protein [Talaromyces proteolyticus]
MRFFAIVAGLAAAVTAYEYPTPFNPTASGQAPSGNPFSAPDTTHPATLGESYEITWQPTTPGPVALVLCQGPSTNCVPTLTIASQIPNSGKFSWTPEGLTPSASSAGGYGIMLIDYSDKTYQYTTQFGILAGAKPATTSTASTTSIVVPTTPTTPTATVAPSTPAVPFPTGTKTWTTKLPLGTGTIGLPTSTPGAPGVPTTVPGTAPTSPVFTAAADHNMASFGAVGAIAGLAALLAF